MNVRWDIFTLPSGRTHPQIHVTDSSDWGLFERLAARLKDELKGRWMEKLDCLDQRYWDLETEHGRLTLHLEHYLGISLYADKAISESEGRAMLEKAFGVLISYDPA
jgi:hypothetical protein